MWLFDEKWVNTVVLPINSLQFCTCAIYTLPLTMLRNTLCKFNKELYSIIEAFYLSTVMHHAVSSNSNLMRASLCVLPFQIGTKDILILYDAAN